LVGSGARLVILAVGINVALVGVALAAPGDLDPAFGDDGVVTTNFSDRRDAASALAIQSDGKIVAAGVANGSRDSKFALTRYHPDGSLDDTFGGDGKVVTNLTRGEDFASDLVIQPDGKIVATGRAGGSRGRFATVRYETDGSLDVTFGDDGIVTTNFTRRNDFASGVAIQADGSLVVVGRARDRSESDSHGWDSGFALARYLPDGSRDATFSLDGKILANLTQGEDYAFDVAIQPDERIVVVGRGGGARGRFAIVRYKPRGVRDRSFGGDGRVYTNFARNEDLATSVAIQSDGRIVVAGTASRNVFGASFALARYDPGGSLDPSFSGDGKVVTRFAEYFDGWMDDIANDVELQSDGKIVAAGSSFRSVLLGMCCDRFTAIARFTPEGVLDDSFSGDGKVVTDIGPSHGANGLAIQDDGKIVTAGEAFIDQPVSTFVLLRYFAA
jgi:uncharacterized delta-60 repeat protein